MNRIVIARPRVIYPRLNLTPRVGLIATPIWAITVIAWIGALMVYAVLWATIGAVYALVIAATWTYHAGTRRWHAHQLPDTPEPW